jgi:2-iminobutanoate/2-iminopropanoate deaminase
MSPVQLTGKIASSGQGEETLVSKKAICAPQVLNEAYDYPRPSSFSRGTRVDIRGVSILLISGTASIDETGATVHAGDFRAQTWRTFRNITALLECEGASWKDVVRTTCYLRDIERDYAVFNEIRTLFYKEQGLNPLPASTGIQAILCRPDLLVEMEAMAIFETDRSSASKAQPAREDLASYEDRRKSQLG